MQDMWISRVFLFLLAGTLAACASSVPYKSNVGDASLECGIRTALENPDCATRSPEFSTLPAYTLHFVEIDDQGWLYPKPESSGFTPEMGAAHSQIDRAIKDIATRLAEKDHRVLLLIYVHGWKHSAAHNDRDVRRFRQMLSDAADADSRAPSGTRAKRTVVGIYLGWQGGGAFSGSNPLDNMTFWTRKNTALHISEGSSRELFSRIRALRERVNDHDAADASPHIGPRLRTVVMGHSFGAWIVYSALAPSLIELLAQPLDVVPEPSPAEKLKAWRRSRMRQAADLVLLVNPAFEASRYQPLHSLAQRGGLPSDESPVLILITAKTDGATGKLFPIGRFFNTIFQRPFVSDEQNIASQRTPGFMIDYQTHKLSHTHSQYCPGWKGAPIEGRGAEQSPAETESARRERFAGNIDAEIARAKAWHESLKGSNGTLKEGWEWEYCGGSLLKHVALMPQSPIWNVVADEEIIKDHSDIMGEALHSFLRQLYLTLQR